MSPSPGLASVRSLTLKKSRGLFWTEKVRAESEGATCILSPVNSASLSCTFWQPWEATARLLSLQDELGWRTRWGRPGSCQKWSQALKCQPPGLPPQECLLLWLIGPLGIIRFQHELSALPSPKSRDNVNGTCVHESHDDQVVTGSHPLRGLRRNLSRPICGCGLCCVQSALISRRKRQQSMVEPNHPQREKGGNAHGLSLLHSKRFGGR